MDAAVPAHTTHDVLAALAHKLGSPLGAILNLAHLLPAADPDTEVERHAGDIGVAARRASRYLDGARRWMEAAALRHDPEALDLAALAEQQAAAEGVALRLGPVPPAMASEAAWRLMLTELLRNARAAAAPGAARVRVWGAADAQGVLVEVGDEGPAWSREDGARAFGLFTSLGSGSNGAGMGLPIVSALARAQGGWAEVAVDSREGARVRIRLPAVR